jgi:hypothetical protein
MQIDFVVQIVQNVIKSMPVRINRNDLQQDALMPSLFLLYTSPRPLWQGHYGNAPTISMAKNRCVSGVLAKRTNATAKER